MHTLPVPNHQHPDSDLQQPHYKVLEHLQAPEVDAGHSLTSLSARQSKTVEDAHRPFPYYAGQPDLQRKLDGSDSQIGGFGTQTLWSVHLELHGLRPAENIDPAPELQVTDIISGRPWTIRVVRPGDRYGLNDCLLHDRPGLLVEFYDRGVRNLSEFGPRGQLVSQYGLDTLVQHLPSRASLDLHGGVDVWWVSGGTVAVAVGFARDQLRRQEAG